MRLHLSLRLLRKYDSILINLKDVLLDVIQRPPVISQEEARPIECLEILDSDEVNVGDVKYSIITQCIAAFALQC